MCLRTLLKRDCVGEELIQSLERGNTHTHTHDYTDVHTHTHTNGLLMTSQL